jgi:hypothetical protein
MKRGKKQNATRGVPRGRRTKNPLRGSAGLVKSFVSEVPSLAVLTAAASTTDNGTRSYANAIIPGIRYLLYASCQISVPNPLTPTPSTPTDPIHPSRLRSAQRLHRLGSPQAGPISWRAKRLPASRTPSMRWLEVPGRAVKTQKRHKLRCVGSSSSSRIAMPHLCE